MDIHVLIDPLKALVMRYINSVKLLKIMKMYPNMRPVFKKYRQLIPLNFQNTYITDVDLLYMRYAHTINLKNCRNITDIGIFYLKYANSINVVGCNSVTQKCLSKLKNAHGIIMFDRLSRKRHRSTKELSKSNKCRCIVYSYTQ